jgi:anti-anti-sigma factor
VTTCGPAGPLAVEARLAGGTATVCISGELDLASLPFLAAQLSQILQGSPRRLVFDLTRVGFIDVAAARQLASTAQSLPEGGRPVIRSASPLVRRLLELTGLDGQFEIVTEPAG